MLETPLSRRERAPCLEGHVRMACSNVSGSRPQRGQDVSASGDLQVGLAARYILPDLISWILPAMNFPKPMKGRVFKVGRWW